MSGCIPTLAAALGLLAVASHGLAPVDPELIPAGRRVLDYFESIYGKMVLAGMNGEREQTDKLFAKTGKRPSVVNIDLTGWHAVKYGPAYVTNSRAQVGLLKDWWEKSGMIPTLTWHWANPMGDNGDFDASKSEFMALDMVPILFRPLHEIDGGWFWGMPMPRPSRSCPR